MSLDSFIDNVAAQFDDTDRLQFAAGTKFRELQEWSSLTAISIISMVQVEYGVKVSGEDIKSVNTIQELYDLVTGSKNDQDSNGYSIRPVDEGNVIDLQKCAARFGMPRSEGWLRRCLFDPAVADKVIDKIRGHVAFDTDGTPVASQGYYYIPCYYKQKQILGHTVCFKSAFSKCGESLLSVLDRNAKTREKTELGFGNCIASMRSAEINMKMYGWGEPPERSRTYRVCVTTLFAYPILALRRIWKRMPKALEVVFWLSFLPIQLLVNIYRKIAERLTGYSFVGYTTIDEVKFTDFWDRFLSANTGVISSREPKRLKWLFEDSIKVGKVVLVAAERNGKIEGYFMLRMSADARRMKIYDVIDICSVGNDVKCLRSMTRKMLSTVCGLGGIKINFYGYMSRQSEWLDRVFKICRYMDHPTFLYKAESPEVRESLLRNDGWFFGPFDGEFCLGHGGYIDL